MMLFEYYVMCQNVKIIHKENDLNGQLYLITIFEKNNFNEIAL